MNVRHFIPALLVATLGTVALPAAAQQKLLPAQSSISFEIRQMGVPVQGHFKRFDAQINFDAAKLAASKVHFTVDIASTTLGAPEMDAELPKPTWFNTAKFPQAQFTSSAFKALGGGKYEVTGKLAIKGQSQDVTVPLTMTQAGAATTASGVLPIKRLAFRIGEGDWADTSMVADDVQVRFKLALSGVGKL
ncbi:YceI family protein [Rhodoferax sp.]|uniref:YceI family protein n=1 Tax=Rhodoferax sp. TaxID=50421 RepID=UPI00272F0783|nr:YceI family protein [Rhodoferax sp.]MDP1529971.1 YceI family protein [Rhodoferax sp.]MDP1942744.1 YceI family protein [Rhodoferax sp.]MDP2443441.1 YceI family protein [Rhodoferax sp.]MDZ4206310.1 YceI family protein [Rhodoferax sp.]